MQMLAKRQSSATDEWRRAGEDGVARFAFLRTRACPRTRKGAQARGRERGEDFCRGVFEDVIRR